jgi:hypothetical protein
MELPAGFQHEIWIIPRALERACLDSKLVGEISTITGKDSCR